MKRKTSFPFAFHSFLRNFVHEDKTARMRILIVNTSERSGGAAVAAHRLMEALNNNGEKVRMLVSDKETDDINVVGLKDCRRAQWNFLWERWCIFWKLRFNKRHLFEIDIANAGNDITRLREFREADVVHLHWVNQGMLSLQGIRKILDSGKPVVWTMHDVWPATAICHLTLGCRNFMTRCRRCKYLPGKGGENDLSAQVWRRKQQLLKDRNIVFVACSKWLQGEARKSALLAGQRIDCIPNPIDLHVFRPANKQNARKALQLPTDKRLILFVSQRVTNVNKGMDFLVEACRQLAEEHPEMKLNTGVVILGGHADELEGKLPFEVFPLGYVSDIRRIVEVYRAADVFVLPSLSENLPNTIMEAMACGVPCVGFRVGGIPEEIDHMKNGYVAAYRDAADLAKGIGWVLDECDYTAVSAAAVSKVASNYSQANVAMHYIEIYNEACAMAHYNL